MAKFDFDVAVGFAVQSVEGTYNPTLDAVGGTWGGDPDGTDEGLLLGDSESGIGGSGLTLQVGRRHRDKAPLSGGFTRPLSDFLAAEVRSMTFAFPFCGPRRTVSTPRVDADFAHLLGFSALLAGAGLVEQDWSGGEGKLWTFGSPEPFSALVFYFGNRLKLLDCRLSSLSVDFTPGTIPIATAEIAVGSVYDPSAKGFAAQSLPTLSYGAQASESAPVVEQVAHTWQDTKGFQSLELRITPSVEEVADSNAVGGLTREPSDRETRIEATLFADDADKVYELDQAFATASGDLDALNFQVGTTTADGGIAKAIKLSVPQPELDTAEPTKLGSKAGNTVSLIARHGTVSGNELGLIFL